MRFKKLEAKPNFEQMQAEALKFWEEGKTFEKSVSKESKGEKVFYDGPPFPTGMPHNGTVMVSFIKDMISRYFTMKGYSVPRTWGWDCHGLPIETQAEKILGVTDKTQIDKVVGIDKFNQECYNIVSQNVNSWKEYVDNMARWCDYEHSYKTMDKNYMESVLWTFKKCFDKGYIYKDYRVTPYCYRCETALSISDTRESDSTRPRQDRWVMARFRAEKDIENKPTYFLAWTTTPWTLPSNMALAVNAEIEYAFVEVEDGIYVAGKNSLNTYPKVFGAEPKIIKVVKGIELENEKYIPLLPYFADKKEQGAFKVICADYVAEGEGLSVVHIAPAFGEDDYWACKKYSVPLVNPVDEKGRFTNEITDFAGKNVIEVNGEVIKFLNANKLIVADGSLVHNYPHCWRCKTPLIYKAMDAWYVNIEKLKPTLLSTHEQVNYVPNTVKEGRFGNWLRNARDWNISRNRYWGTPIPVWECSKCGKREVLGSIEEIKEKSGIELNDLHRQFIDKCTYDCECGGKMQRVPEVLDCWFDSACAPHARLHYPFENKKWFDEHNPSDFVAEYVGQIRGWFYYLHVLAGALFEKPAYQNCIIHGTILANDGKKVSKSSKNYTDPMVLFKTMGTDALRLYLYRSKAILLDDMQFDDNGIQDQLKSIILPLWNAFNFFISYAEIDGFTPNENEDFEVNNELDKWILALLYQTEKEISGKMDNYLIDGYVEPVSKLVDGLTNWYIRRSRRRFYGNEMTADKLSGYNTMFYVLNSISKLLAPITPFVSEKLFNSINEDGVSVHLQNWPEVKEEYKNDKLLEEINVVQQTIYLARVLREKNNVKNRQPLQTVMIYTNDNQIEIINKYSSIILEELNVKEISIVDEVEKIAKMVIKPNFNIIRSMYAGSMPEIIKSINQKQFEIKENAVLIGNEQFSKDILLIEYVANNNLPVISDSGIVVSLDLNLSEDLLREGCAREIIRNVQDARKQLGCELVERISINFKANVPNEWREFICSETLSKENEISNADLTINITTQIGEVIVEIKRN